MEQMMEHDKFNNDDDAEDGSDDVLHNNEGKEKTVSGNPKKRRCSRSHENFGEIVVNENDHHHNDSSSDTDDVSIGKRVFTKKCGEGSPKEQIKLWLQNSFSQNNTSTSKRSSISKVNSSVWAVSENCKFFSEKKGTTTKWWKKKENVLWRGTSLPEIEICSGKSGEKNR